MKNPDRTGQIRTEPDKTGQNRTKPDKTGQKECGIMYHVKEEGDR